MKPTCSIFLFLFFCACKNVAPKTTTIVKTDAITIYDSTHTPAAKINTDTVTANSPFALKVILLPTIYGTDGPEDYGYPAYVAAKNAGTLIDSIAAYGAGSKVWLGPKGWTGKGAYGADGNVVATLYSPTDTARSAARVSYYEVPACSMCILESAADYFPEAMKEYNESYNTDHTMDITIPMGQKTKQVSPNIVIYTLPEHDDLLTTGVAYFQSEGDEYYAEARFVLPKEQQELMGFLIKNFITYLDSTVKYEPGNMISK